MKKAMAKEDFKLRWNTSFALPISNFTVDNRKVKLGKTRNDLVMTSWLPSWWAQMILSQKLKKRVAVTKRLTHNIPAKIDYEWTTSTSNTPKSVWRGPVIWPGWTPGNTRDFRSKIIKGDMSAMKKHGHSSLVRAGNTWAQGGRSRTMKMMKKVKSGL